jgi:hypothetical protein
MKYLIQCAILLLVLDLMFGANPFLCRGQGTLTITFEGNPYQPANAVSLVQSYSESGMWFSPMDSVGFLRNGGATILGNQPWDYPQNGTAYVQAGTASKMSFGFYDESTFGLLSVDLARYFVDYPDINVMFVGYLAVGGTLSTTFSASLPSDNTFHTRHFGPEWAFGLTRVEIPVGSWSMDNLVVIIPEPGCGALLLSGALAALTFRKHRRIQA